MDNILKRLKAEAKDDDQFAMSKIVLDLNYDSETIILKETTIRCSEEIKNDINKLLATKIEEFKNKIDNIDEERNDRDLSFYRMALIRELNDPNSIRLATEMIFGYGYYFDKFEYDKKESFDKEYYILNKILDDLA